MRTIKTLAQSILAVVLFYSCDQGIDGLTQVNPGADASAPQVTINYPLEGTTIKVLESVTSITVDFEVTDDIEVATIEASIDGNKIATMNNFLDYRRVLVEDLIYDNLDDGSHEFTVNASDLEGKTTSVTVNFVKEPAYVAQYSGETLYMPFDGDYFDLVGLRPAEQVGSPGFLGEGFVGLNAYEGALESYLTLPTEGLQESEFSAIFWINVNDAANIAGSKRAGVLIMSPPLIDGTSNDLTKGFRFFREEVGENQRFKLNVGSGSSGHWFDGGEAADVSPDAGWTHMAITMSQTTATVYINGEVVSSGDFPGLDWTDCDILSIMSGAPNFSGWNHWSDQSSIDELRMFDRALSQDEIQNIMTAEAGGFVGTFDGEMFYMPFEGDTMEMFTASEAEVVGSPGFAGEGASGDNAYAGATDSYLTFPSGSITTAEFSATMWYKLNADPNRAGILVMGPPMANGGADNDLTKGFRFFREDAGGMQRFKLNVGFGDGGSWFDGGAAADVDPGTATDWIHLAFTISGTEAVVYIDGEVVSQGTFAGVDWTDCDVLSIMSGAPNFTGWNHWSDLSHMDELRLYDKALSQEEVQSVMSLDQ
ncbi:MAG: LamG-like jellyroll fold domain-containing protein [Flavobacteriaceae bacterium]